MSDRRLFIDEAILLIAVGLALAVAEGAWWMAAGVALAVPAGWYTTVRKNRPILKPLSSRIFVVSAFLFLLVDDYLLETAAVLALSHFMEFVCISKLLQARGIRDHAQMLILLLLLLAVSAIVTGSLLFPVALVAYLTIGLDALMRFHLELERLRVEQRNEGTTAVAQAPAATCGDAAWSGRWVAVPLAVAGLLTGAAVFVLCPRFSSPFLISPLSPMSGTDTMTGFSGDLDMNTLGPIQESDRPVMRVVLESGGTPLPEFIAGPYFRGTVSTQYVHNVAAGGRWEWRRFAGEEGGTRLKVPGVRGENGIEFDLLPSDGGTETPRLITQHYTMQVNGGSCLFNLYPPMRVYMDPQTGDSVKKWVEDQVLQPERVPLKPLRYVVRSFASPAAASEPLQIERRSEGVDPPQACAVDTLPRADEFQSLLETLRAGLGPLDVPENRLTFLRRVEEYLRPPRFTYTLDPPSPGRDEPIGEFLFTYRRGHCVYFASSMAVLCQLAGVPARVVSGFCGGEYNPVGKFYMVRQKHAHSWVEVYVPGQEWVTCDPTPSGALAQHNVHVAWRSLVKYLDYLHWQWSNLVLSFDAEQRRALFAQFTAWLLRPVQNETGLIGGLVAFVRELFGWRLKLTWGERSIYWAFTALVISLVLLVGYAALIASRGLLRIWRLRPGRRIGLPEVAFYYRFARQMSVWGLQRRPEQTPAEFAAELAGRFPVLADAPDLVRAYYQVLFGRQRLLPARREAIDAYLLRLEDMDARPAVERRADGLANLAQRR